MTISKFHNPKTSLGCGLEYKMNTNSGFICGVANANGSERLCPECDRKLRIKWDEEDKGRNEKYLNSNKLKKEVKNGLI